MNKNSRIIYLDGLRGLGAVMVAVGHFGNDFGTTESLLAGKNVLFFLFDGSLAVYIFFIVSGYALTTSICENKGRFSLSSAIWKRYIRLEIPVALSIIFALLFFVFKLLPTEPTQDEVWSQSSYRHEPSITMAIFEAVWGVLISGYNKLNPPLWTLKWEFIASIILYIATYIFSTNCIKHSIFKIVTAFIVGTIGLLVFHNFYFLYFIFFYGVAFRMIDERITIDPGKPPPEIIDLFWIIVFIGAACVSPYLSNPETTGIVIVAIAIHGSAKYSKSISNLFSSRIFIFLGKISFPLYLTHFPIFCAFSVKIHNKLLSIDLPQPEIATMLVMLMMSIFVATVFSSVENALRCLVYRYISSPFISKR